MENNKKIIKPDKLLNKGLLNSLCIPMIVILLTAYFTDGIEKDFKTLINIICSIFALLISIIVYSKIPNIKKDFVKYIGIGFLYLGLIDFVEIFLNSTNSTLSIGFSLSVTSSAMESIIILYAVLMHKQRYGFAISNIIFSSNMIIIFVVAEFVIKAGNYEYIITRYGTLDLFVSIILMTITIYLLKNDKDIILKKEKQWLIKITMFFSSYDIINSISYISNREIGYFQVILKLSAYVLAYKYVEAKLMNNGYRDALYKLISIQETGKVLNKSLIQKERLLKESQINIKKGEEQYERIIGSIADGIFIFENNILMYVNNYGIKYLPDKFNVDVENMNIELVLKIITNENISIEKINSGFVEEFKYSKDENIFFNITLTLKNTVDSEKILLVRDSTGLVELQKLREEREKAKVTEVIKDEFYSNISHELRTPINVVNSALQLNNLMLDNNNLEGMIKNNNIIRQNCLRLIRTVNNFIDTNRISEGFLEPNKKVYNIVNIVESVVLACNKYMVLMDNQLIFDTELEEIYISCDKEHIERIMLNILSNSLKYGKVAGKIDVRIKSSKEEINIIVRNDAPPVPEEQKNLIFDKFTKLDSSLARPSEGSGLGLYLTKELVELNGGNIKMSSSYDIGNVFEIKIPFVFSGEPWEVDVEENSQNLDEKVNIEFSDIYFN